MRKNYRRTLPRALSAACAALVCGLPVSGQMIDAAALPVLSAPRLAPDVSAARPAAALGAAALVSLSAPRAALAGPALAAAPAAALAPAAATAAAPAVGPSAAFPALAAPLAAPAARLSATAPRPPAVSQAAAPAGPPFDGATAPAESAVAVPEAHAAEIARARGYFEQRGIPVAEIAYTAGYYREPDMPMADSPSWEEPYFTIRFQDVEAYRRWKPRLPGHVDGVSVYPDGKQHAALLKTLQSEKEAALIARARDYFRRKAFAVADVSYEAGHDDGLGIGEGSSWVPPSFTVVFADQASYARWQERLFRSVEGIKVRAVLAPPTGGPYR